MQYTHYMIALIFNIKLIFAGNALEFWKVMGQFSKYGRWSPQFGSATGLTALRSQKVYDHVIINSIKYPYRFIDTFDFCLPVPCPSHTTMTKTGSVLWFSGEFWFVGHFWSGGNFLFVDVCLVVNRLPGNIFKLDYQKDNVMEFQWNSAGYINCSFITTQK